MNLYQKGQIDKLKLVIWDLDETFWKGTIDNGDIPKIPKENVSLIKELTDHGIVNSICSKNDYQRVKSILEKNDLWDYFVFPSIDWTPKGSRIKNLLKEMGLRPANTLFIDDNHLNIEEAEFYSPGLITAFPEVTSILLNEVKSQNSKVDLTHKRLKQYKILQNKASERKNYSSAKEFLLGCHIKVVIHEDCRTEEHRIYELIQRSNQLNFTKVRSSEEEVKTMLADSSYKCGTVWVSDRFGDYGMVGFYAVKNHIAEHFLFSCRTIGMGIEQYVYQKIGCPNIHIIGDVVSELGNSESMEWINVKSPIAITKKGDIDDVRTDKKILLIGGCDLEQTAYYLEQSGLVFDSKFNYVANKRFECHPDSLINIRASVEYTDNDKKYLIDNCVFYDKNVFDNSIFENGYDVIIYSPLIDYSNGLYKSKETNLYAVYGNKDFPKLDTDGYMTVEEQIEFEKKFDFCGGISSSLFKDNLEWLIQKLPKETHVFLLNAAELDFPHPLEKNRYLTHIRMNQILRDVCDTYDNASIIDVSSLVKDQRDYSDSIRHYNRKVYYQIATLIIGKLQETGILDGAMTVDKSTLGIISQLRHMILRIKQGRIRDDIHSNCKAMLKKIGLLEIAYTVIQRIKK